MTPTSDKKMTNFMWIVGTILVIFCGAWLTVALSYGGTRNQVNVDSERISKLERTSVNYIYVEYIVESNQRVVKIMEATPGSPERTKALLEWQEFQDEVLKRANPVRGGATNEKNLN